MDRLRRIWRCLKILGNKGLRVQMAAAQGIAQTYSIKYGAPSRSGYTYGRRRRAWKVGGVLQRVISTHVILVGGKHCLRQQYKGGNNSGLTAMEFA